MFKNKSVLNTDSFDRRRYQEIRKMSQKLGEIERMGSSLLPSFSSLMGDIWAGLYKMDPRLKDEVERGLEANRVIMERILNEDSFQSKRELTRLDDLMSAIGTIKFSKAVYKWLQTLDEQAQKAMQKAMEEARKAMESRKRKKMKSDQGNNQGEAGQGGGQQKGTKRQDALNKAMQEVANALEQQSHEQKKMLEAMLQQAMQETLETKEALQSLVGGLQPGSGEAELKKVPLRDQIRLAEVLVTNQKLKQIAMWAGRFKQIAMKKQRSKHRESIERSGVTLGNQVERLLPMELGMYMSPATRMDFLRRFAEGQTMQYEQTGKEELGKGPIVLCLDQSDSMMGSRDIQAKGFALALMSIARKQRRDFSLIRFSYSFSVVQQIYRKGKISINEMVKLAIEFLGGGTDFEAPLDTALRTINKSRFKKADIIFVTDGEDYVSDQFLEYFHKSKKEKDFSVLSIVLGDEMTETVEKFSDRVVKASDFTDEKTHVAFEI
jgi:uncharacterized protein with von Willebrand factor type A (vWA) domain